MIASKNAPKKSRRGSSFPEKKAKADQLAAGAWFDKLVALQARLRAPNGCPWDREQTHETLRTYLIEEAYEVLDALDSGEDAKFAEELGDLLLQIVFHSQIAREESRFTISDVIREVHEKMVRRHPHVFGTKVARDSAEVLKNWHQIKAKERRASSAQTHNGQERPSLLDGVPRSLPGLLEGLQLTKKAARAGFDWDALEGVLGKLNEEVHELRRATESNSPAKLEEELGDIFFAGVNLARFLQVDPEIALKKANAKFLRRFQEMERLASASGRSFEKLARQEKEALWDAVKRNRIASAARATSQNR
jgi:tetrapyrrole methylase family protein / MazG family protein